MATQSAAITINLKALLCNAFTAFEREAIIERTNNKFESVALQRFQICYWFGFERKAL